MEHLCLSYNELKELNENVFNGLDNLNKLDLSQNRPRLLVPAKLKTYNFQVPS